MTEMTSAATALAVLELVRAGRFTEITEKFAPALRPMVPPDALRAAWESGLARNGQVSSVGEPTSEPAGPGAVVIKIPVSFTRGAATVAVGLAGEQHWITGIQLLPASAAEPATPWEPPPYADPERFTEQEVTLGDGPLAVGGTLCLPRQAAGVPGLVLLPGSGPQDRDETIGRNKPLRDLAWGLASAGTAVLRFDKVTFAHGEEVAADLNFTLTDEYVPHAVAAIRLLAQLPGVDAGRIYLAGHSLGGTVAPRVAAAEPSVAGLIILAGGAQPLHWSAVRQVRYLADLDRASAEASRAAIEVLTRQASLIDSAGLTPQTPPGDLPFGTPPRYWLDLRGYDPAGAAAALGKPILVIQGGRDYQVTVADDLSRWEAALNGRPRVTIRICPADNHLFFPGTGPSAPAEYEPAQHVDPDVITAIAQWLSLAPQGTAVTPGQS